MLDTYYDDIQRKERFYSHHDIVYSLVVELECVSARFEILDSHEDSCGSDYKSCKFYHNIPDFILFAY